MDNRLKQLIKLNIKDEFIFLGKMAVLIFLLIAVLPNLISLVTQQRLLKNYPAVDITMGLILLGLFFLPIMNFEQQFKIGLQNGFSRKQIYTAQLMVVSALVILFTVVENILPLMGIGSNDTTSYDHYFSNALINGVAMLLIGLLSNAFFLNFAQLLGAFGNLFGRRIRIWIIIASCIGLVLVNTAVVNLFTLGINILLRNQIIASDSLTSFGKLIISILFGYREQGAYNPLNLIGTLLVANVVIMYITRLIIYRLQIHRER